jgi:hypothetical protein
MNGHYPTEDEQRTLLNAGDAVDEQLMTQLRARFADAQFTIHTVRQWKEKFSFVGEPARPVIVTASVGGKPTTLDITNEVRRACESLVPPIVETRRDLISHTDPDYQEKLRQNIILAGGGSQVAGLGEALTAALAEVGGGRVLAVQDPAIPFVSSRDGLQRHQELGIPCGHPYFNAGVMVVNVERWRRSNVSERVMAFIRRNASELKYCDQDGLNAILWKDWEAVDSRWQVQPRLMARHRLPLPHLDERQRTQMTTDPWILHFSGRLKPWIYRGSTLPDRIFYEYLDRTWWTGWRPPPSMKAWMYRLYDSSVRDWCYPLEQRGHALMRRLSRRSEQV